MFYRKTVLWTWFILFAISTPLTSQTFTYQQGISDVSLGRFAAWPKIGLGTYSEDDLAKRIYPDHMERSHVDLQNIWTVWFGTTGTDISRRYFNQTPAPAENEDIWPLEQNWVYKKFAVRRYTSGRDSLNNTIPVPMEDGGMSPIDGNYPNRGYTYSVSVNSVSPGTRIQSEYDLFYLEAPSYRRFGYMAYQVDGESEVIGELYNRTAIIINEAELDLIDENWILIWYSTITNTTMDPGANYPPEPVQIPLLISFSHPLKKVTIDSRATSYPAGGMRDIKFEFKDIYDGLEKTVFMSLPFGVDAVDTTTTNLWADGLPQSVIDRCREVNRIVNNWPVGVDEDFRFESVDSDEPERVFIKNTFTYSYMGTLWAYNGYVPNTKYYLIPPILSLAKDKGLDVNIPSRYILPQISDTICQTKLGPLYMLDYDITSIEYEIPGAPVHDVHLVGTTCETEWKQRVNRMINATALSYANYCEYVTPFNNFCSKGESACLAMTREWTREHYIFWMKEIVEKKLFDIDGSRIIGDGVVSYSGWQKMDNSWWNATAGLPGEGSWPEFWTLLCTSEYKPYDIDASAGAALEFLYEYWLWSGDFLNVQSHWTTSEPDYVGITDIFKPLELFQDWAFMAGSHDIWGGSGATMDMFNAQMAGYHSFGKIAEALGHENEAARARYLAAKAQIPFMMRWVAMDYVEDYFKTISDPKQVISGFGEWEPSGPMSGFNSNNTEAFTIDHWADWAFSGESIHLLGYDILHSLYEPFIITPVNNSIKKQLVDFIIEYFSLDDDEYDYATFFENKLYSFFRWRNELPFSKTIFLNYLAPRYTSTIGDHSNGKLNGLDHMYQKYSASDWTTGAGSFTDEGLKQARVFPLMPAVMEAYGVPVRVGSWAPAKMNTAVYDPETEIFTASFAPGPSSFPDAVVRLQVSNQPTRVVATTGSIGTVGYDDLWKVSSIPLTGSGPWTIEVTVPKETGSSWTEVDTEPNLIGDSGFEESGYGKANYEIAWEPWPPSNVHTTDDDKYSGNQSVRLSIPSAGAGAQILQRVWVGADNEVNISFRYKLSSEDINMQVAILEMPGEIGYGNLTTNARTLYNGWYSCPPGAGTWQYFSYSDTLSSDMSVVSFRIYLLGNQTLTPGITHEGYIDDVTITSPDLDMGNLFPPPFVLQEEREDIILPTLSEFSIHPNPFNPTTIISFRLGRTVPAEFKIYDVAGREIKCLVRGNLEAGLHRITWDGKNNNGATTSSGVYFYKIKVADITKTGKVVLLK